ncbi:MAG: radical SAM protein [Magnetococcales bacterium]|nr:radical SAM protein [Magnetococcales bacterium]
MNILKEIIRTLSVPLLGPSGWSPFKPVSISIDLTENCNSQCNMCDCWRTSGERFSFERLRPLLDDLVNWNVTLINYVAAGEIFTHPEIREILSYTKKKGFEIILNTNALALSNPSWATFVAQEIQPLSISIGIDSIRDETYQEIRGVPKGASKIKKAISHLQEAGYHNIGLGAVILPANLDQLTEMVHFTREQGVEVRFTAYEAFFQEEEAIQNELQRLAREGILQERIGEIIQLKKSHAHIKSSVEYLKRIPDYYLTDKYFPLPCRVGFLRANIAINGDTFFCHHTKPYGNVFQQSIDEIWFSKAARNTRQQMVAGECPGCWLNCFGEENIRFSPRLGFRSNLDGLKRYLKLKAQGDSPK